MELAKQLQAVTDQVRQQAPAQVVATMEEATRRLAESGLPARALKAGQRMPDFELPDATGMLVRSAELRSAGPLVASFYRGHWCPYCSLEIKALQGRLGDIRAKGGTLVAISPQTPDQSLTTREKHGLEFPVLSDAGNRVARSFGLVFEVDDSLMPIYESFGIDLSAHNGDQSHELPVPATYVVGTDGTVVDAFIDVDYRRRLAPETVLEWLERARLVTGKISGNRSAAGR